MNMSNTGHASTLDGIQGVFSVNMKEQTQAAEGLSSAAADVASNCAAMVTVLTEHSTSLDTVTENLVTIANSSGAQGDALAQLSQTSQAHSVDFRNL